MFDNEAIDVQKKRCESIRLNGRQQIYSPFVEVTEENIIDFLTPVISAFSQNKREMDYLYWYRRGIQPILWRTKEIRKSINNKVIANLADEITIFKNGYFLTKPAFYVSRSEKKAKTKQVDRLNNYLWASGKHKADNEVVNWFHTVGVGVMYVEANKDASTREESPISVYSLDPRTAFVVYSLRPGNPALAGINIVAVDNEKVEIDVYTKNKIFICEGGYKSKNSTDNKVDGMAVRLINVLENSIGEIPMVEYVMNRNRMSCFESVIPLMDTLNKVMSNATDGIEQFIQSLCVAVNTQFEEGVTAETIRDAGMITLTSTDGQNVDFKILSEQLDQTQTQVTINNLLDRINSIAGVPFSTQSTGGTSDNVGAVYLRNGYEIADTFVRDTEDCFRDSNRAFDKLMLATINSVLTEKKLDITTTDIDIQFSRSELENLLTKSQSALNLMQLGLAPEVILEKTGLSNDPLSDIARSEKYIKQKFEIAEKETEPKVPEENIEKESSNEELPLGDAGKPDGTDEN